MNFKTMFRSLILLSCLFPVCFFAQHKKFYFDQPKMGTECRIILWHSDSTQAASIAREAYGYADSLIRIFSDYLPDSEVSVINRSAGLHPMQMSTHMQRLIGIGKRACTQSGGAFTIAMGPLSILWRKARSAGQLPPADEIKKQLRLCHCADIVTDTSAKTVFLKHRGMALDFGGIAKGYIAQQMLTFIQSRGIRYALVDAGGDLCASEGYAKPWSIAVNLPEQSDAYWDQNIQINDQSVATSGDIFQHLQVGEKKYSHIIDPLSGYGVHYSRNVTVVATDGATADWLATACSVLPVRKAKKLVKKSGAHLMMSWISGGQLNVVKTKHFPIVR